MKAVPKAPLFLVFGFKNPDYSGNKRYGQNKTENNEHGF